MKKYIKVITVVLIFLCIMIVLKNLSFATTSYDFESKIESTFDNSKAYDNSAASNSVRSFTGVLVLTMQIIATGIAIIMLIVLAIKYMVSAPGDRAEIKKHATVYIIGAVVLFATTAILEIISQFTTNF